MRLPLKCHPISFLTLFLLFSSFNAQEDTEYAPIFTESPSIAGPLSALKTKYSGLTPKGRFIAMAASGFIGSRLVMDIAATSLKFAGAAFIM